MNDFFESWGEPATRVVVPHLMISARTPVRPRALLQVEGRQKPIVAKGTHRYETWVGRATYGAVERPKAAALFDLFDAVFDGPQGRLRLVAGIDIQGTEIDTCVWVDYTEPRDVGSVTFIDMTITEVDAG